MGMHIFWDNSNIWGGASTLRKIIEPDVPWFALRIYFKNVFELIAYNSEQCITRVMAGSVPPECEELWEYARKLNFDTDLLYRVKKEEDNSCEQGVDEILHMKIANAILDYDPPQTLVILSGDGAESNYGTSFPGQAERALKKGWNVKIYSWGPCLNRAKFPPLVELFPGRMEIIELDPYYYSLTFVKGGKYYEEDDSGNKLYFTVPDRIVKPLKL